MSNPSYRLWPAQSPTFASGGSSVVPMSDLPAGRVLGVLIRIKTDVTQGAGAVAITGTQLQSLVALVRFRDYIRATGRGLFFMRWAMNGFAPNVPQDVPAAAGVYSRFVEVFVPFADFAAVNPLDTCIDSRLLADQPLEVNWGDVTALYGAGTTLGSTSVRVLALLDKPAPGDIAAQQRIDYTDWTGQSILLPAPGGISHCLIYSETSDAITDAAFATFTVFTDGDNIKPVLQTGELVAEYDIMRAAGVTPLASATGQGGEAIIDEPGTGAGAGQGLTVPWIPLIVQPDKYSIGHIPVASQQLRIDYTGTSTTARIMTRTIQFTDNSRITEIARKLGLSDPMSRKRGVKIAGPGRLDATRALLLPKQVGLTAEEIRQRGGTA